MPSTPHLPTPRFPTNQAPSKQSTHLTHPRVPHHATTCRPFHIPYNNILKQARIDVSRRLRRAILLNDLPLVKRIIRNNPAYLRNTDFEDCSNTSLHLAAKHGFVAIAEFLIEEGHEQEKNSGDVMISRNNDWETPLMIAAAAGKEDMGVTLAKRFPECIGWQDRNGLDAVRLTLPFFTLTSALPIAH